MTRGIWTWLPAGLDCTDEEKDGCERRISVSPVVIGRFPLRNCRLSVDDALAYGAVMLVVVGEIGLGMEDGAVRLRLASLLTRASACSSTSKHAWQNESKSRSDGAPVLVGRWRRVFRTTIDVMMAKCLPRSSMCGRRGIDSRCSNGRVMLFRSKAWLILILSRLFSRTDGDGGAFSVPVDDIERMYSIMDPVETVRNSFTRT